MAAQDRPATQQRLVVVGNGMVGQRLVDALRARDLDRIWRVDVLSEEPRRAYDRVALSSYFDGVSADELDLVDDACYAEPSYHLHLGETAAEVDLREHRVRTSLGRTLHYDK